MTVKRLELECFRSAERVAFGEDFVFDSRMNIFYGDNGAGKSTILDALSLALSWLPAKIRTLSGVGAGIKESDIRNNEFSSGISVIVAHDGKEYAWMFRKVRKGVALAPEKSDYSGASELAKGFVSAGYLNGKGLPVLVSYPVTRAVLDIPLKIRNKHQFEPFNAYDEAFSGAANFRVFFEWFRNREDIENQTARDNGGVILKDRQLDAVRRAIEAFLPDIKDLRIMREPSLHMQAMKRGNPLRVDQLSDGEKCLLAMVGDLARRLAIANSVTESDPLNGEGVVLIDEIDLHLHPSWQRDVVPQLLNTFPNCQFFLSTHSPLVLNNVHPGNLFLVRESDGRMNISRPRASFGKSVVRVLEDVMGLESSIPDSVASPLRDIFNAIAANNLEEARRCISELKGRGFEDPELTRAEVLIRRREVLGK